MAPRPRRRRLLPPSRCPRWLTDPTAKALAYAEDATKVKHAAFKAGSQCANCNFFKGAEGAATGPCTLFPKNSVVAKGWCSAWAKKI